MFMCIVQQSASPDKNNRFLSEESETLHTCVKLMVKMACERLLTSFMSVLAVVRLMFPASISSSTSL